VERPLISVLIQVVAGSSDKKIYNEGTLEYLETRQSHLPYPYPYGFIVETQAEDGDGIDCYIITNDQLVSGTIVECDPVGLLLQDENGEIDHKVLAAIPGQEVVLGFELLQELQDFIYQTFARFPDIEIRVGPILPREAALQHLQKSRHD
jgi:inorganic pyrophosphatase